jgi:TPR repeat protein
MGASFFDHCISSSPTEKSKAKIYKNTMKRIAANDSIATFEHGIDCIKAGDHNKTIEYLNKAAELGDTESHFCLAGMYHSGTPQGVQVDIEKDIFHYLEEAAIRGHPQARFNFGAHEEESAAMKR